MKKVFSFVLIVFLAINTLFAHGGVMSGHKKLSVYSTKYFNIVYPEECKNSAFILSQNADKIYEDIAKEFGCNASITIPMPVVFTGKVEQFNAYWTSTPYNHIVMYDTASIEDLAVFTEQMLSTFKHEATHAFTFNMHAAGWAVIRAIFGDCINPSALMVTSGRAEGATLVSESSTGEGRLNDEFSNQMVKQAKIEGKFPSYYTVQGAGDDYPRGNFYYFNGAFDQWLVQKYGMEKYASWWYDLVNLKRLTVTGAFKKNYNMSIDLAWGMFYGDIEVPEDTIYEPVKERGIKDFFKSGEKVSSKNRAGALYENLSSYKNGLFYFDENSQAAYILKNDSSRKNGYQTKKLFTGRNLQSAKISKDGRFVALNEYSVLSSTVKMRTRIFDVKKGTFHTINQSGLTDARVFKSGEDYFLFVREYKDHNNKLVSYKIVMKNNRVKGFEKYAERYLSSNSMIQDGTQAGQDGQIVLLLIDGIQTKICVTDTSLSSMQEYEIPSLENQRITLKNVNADDNNNVYFTWIKKGTLPSLGFINLDNGQVSLENVNLNGGVYSPVVLDDGKQVAYIAKCYRFNSLYTKNIQADKITSLQVEKKEMPLLEPYIPSQDVVENKVNEKLPGHSDILLPMAPKTFAEFNEKSTKYNPFSFLVRGIFLPVSSAVVYDFDDKISYSIAQNTPLLGLTYITSDPWNAGLLQLSCGWNILSQNPGVLSLTYKNGTQTSLFSYLVNLTSEFRLDGWARESLAGSVSSGIPFGRFSSLVFGLESVSYYGRKSQFPALLNSSGATVTDDFGFPVYDKQYLNTPFFFTQNVASLSYSISKKTGPGKYQKLGLTLDALAYNVLNIRVEDNPVITVNAIEVGGRARLSIPRLLPFDCAENLCFNLPLRLSGSLFPTSKSIKTNAEEYLFDYDSTYNISGHPIINWAGELLLFGWDCQRAIKGLSALYLNDLRVSLVDKGCIYLPQDTVSTLHIANMEQTFNQNKQVFNRLYLRLELGLTPNVGQLTSSSNNYNCFMDISLAGIDNMVTTQLVSIGINATF